ncbi:hypothetical protein ACFCXP_37020 [Streptomyces niveus]|uniref:hypothetical protein n=1 Tax=Streptomyces niveus TaxID=193462 RepID=UPI0035E026E4
MGLWIGQLGALREITDGARQFDRSPDLGVSEFRSLDGAITAWVSAVRPRRMKISWESMQRDDVNHLDRLARRLDAISPIAVLDPLTRNWLSATQAAGLGSTGRWAWSGADIILYGGSNGETVPNTVSVENVPTSNGPDLFWRHPSWIGFPVMPGMTLTWWAPGLVTSGAALAQLRIEWYDARGTLLSTALTNSPTAPLVRTVPANTVYARPAVRFAAKGMWLLGESVLVLGDVSAALVAGEPFYGDGTPAYSITAFTHAASDGNGAHRDVGLELVEVAGT